MGKRNSFNVRPGFKPGFKAVLVRLWLLSIFNKDTFFSIDKYFIHQCIINDNAHQNLVVMYRKRSFVRD